MRTTYAVVLAGIVCLLTACGSMPVQTTQNRAAAYTALTTRHAGQLTAQQEAWLADLCPFGQPEQGAYYEHEPLTLIVRPGYALMHDDATKTPLWVCEHVKKSDVHGALTGRDSWKTDPVLCNGAVSTSSCARGAVDKDYVRSGYDRGHLAPNWNQRHSEQRKSDTFYFSNAAPQIGQAFNQSVWQDLEEELTLWVQDLDAFWTITGVLYHDEAEDDPQTADGIVQVGTIGNGGVFVPTHFYKVVIWEDGDDLRSMTVVMRNQSYRRDDSFRNHLQSTRWVEQRLGVDFMPQLEPVDADRLEASVGTPYR